MSAVLQRPTYDSVFQALAELNANTSPSEAHGMLCGIICGSGHIDDEALFSKFFGLDTANKSLTILMDLYEATCNQLQAEDFEFDMLLPSEESNLAERVDALCKWCQGFLIGLETIEFQEVENQSVDSTEALIDITEFSAMEFTPTGEDESDEESFEEIREFVKIAVLLLYTEYVLMPSKTVDEKIH